MRWMEMIRLRTLQGREKKLEKLLDSYADKPASMADAGMDYAAEQIQELWKAKVSGIHIYTMNKSEQILEIVKRASIDRACKGEKPC